MNRPTEPKPAGVPQQAAAQAGDANAETTARRRRWSFAEPTVWTDRMLEALEKGVKGQTWFSLIDKVVRPSTLARAWERVRANKGAGGVDGISVEQFGRRAEEQLRWLHEMLTTGRYVPQPVRRKYISKGDGKMRPLGIPTIRDRVVQTALRMVMEPIFEAEFSDRSYGFRPGRGCKDALREVEAMLRRGHRFVVDADLKSYFDTIPKGKLLELVKRRITDGSVLALVESYLKQNVLDGVKEWTPDAGTPQGAVISPLLANLYLDPLDKRMKETGREMIRYADDFVVMCRSREEAEQALKDISAWTVEAGLTLHPEKTRIVDAAERGGFDFLGYHFERGMRWPRKKSLEKLRDSIRAKTPRTSGHSLSCTIASVNLTLRGWFEYFKDSIPNVFRDVDGWVRMRLRAILRKRRKRGHVTPYGLSHQLWPNKFFDGAGLFSLSRARAALAGAPVLTDRRAGCGRSASPVRREGRPG